MIQSSEDSRQQSNSCNKPPCPKSGGVPEIVLNMKHHSPLHTLASLLVLGFSLRAHASSILLDRIEASVNKTPILYSDVLAFKRSLVLRTQLDPLFAGTSLAARGSQAKNSEIVEFLIDEKIISQQFPVSDTDVETEINRVQSNNKIDREKLKRELLSQGFSFDDYFALMKSSATKRNLIDRDISTKVLISEEDVKNHFYNHYANNSSAPRSYQVQIITLTKNSYKAAAAAKEATQKAYRQLLSGEPFEEVAKRFSDNASASAGGDLGELTEDQMSPQIRKELKKLKLGQISGVLGDLKGGFFILKLSGIKTNQDDQYSKMKEEILNQLKTAEFQHQITLWLERERQKAFIHRLGESSVAGLPLSTP